VTAAALLLMSTVVGGCQVGPAPPGPAELRTGPPPWDAPRDAVSYIDKAGFERLPLDFSGPAPYTFTLKVTVDGADIQVPSGVGIDRLRAEQAAVHTHTTDGLVYVEAKTTAEHPTLAQFFTLWGVRYDANCVGDACTSLTVTVNGRPAPWDTPLTRNARITVRARH
jgi:hypothetical protein